MKSYKRTLFELIKGIVIAPFCALGVYVVVSVFIDFIDFPGSPLVVLGIPILVLLALWYMAIFGGNIRFELDEDGTFREYKGWMLKKTFELKNCRIGYRRSSSSGFLNSHDITLLIADAGDKETAIDCGPLGIKQFQKMFKEMEQFAIRDESILSAGNAGKEN
jgi:hypothetical protein